MRKLKNIFTLIELLIVISIIAILMSILLPSLKKARDQTQRIACCNNLNQIGKAVFLYVNDNSSWLPQGGDAFVDDMTPPKECWKSELTEYLGIKDNYTKYDLEHGVYRCPTQNNKLQDTSMGYEGFYGGYGWNGNCGWRENSTNPRKKISEMKNPSNTILSGDTADRYVGYYVFYIYYERIGLRHNNGINCLWGDGHVSHNKYNDLKNHSEWYQM